MTTKLATCPKCHTRFYLGGVLEHDCKPIRRPPCDRMVLFRGELVKCRHLNGGARFRCDTGMRVCKLHKRAHRHIEAGKQDGVPAVFTSIQKFKVVT